MNIFKRLFGNLNLKASAVARQISLFSQGSAIFTPRNYKKLAEEGYIKNVIAYRCIKEIAINISCIQWLLFENEELVENSLITKLLTKPNPNQSCAQFWEAFISFYLIDGNSYIEAVTAGLDVETNGDINKIVEPPIPGVSPQELWILHPDRMRIEPSKSGMIKLFEHDVNGQKTQWLVDQITGASKILHLKDFHPTNDWYGLAPIQPAGFSIDQHNAAGEHNAALLQNGARPGGMLKHSGNEDQAKRLKQAFDEMYSSPKNAGRPLIIDESAEWIEMSRSPKELDFHETKRDVARDICNAFRVPHVLIIPGESTFRNQEEARLMFWEQTIIPLLNTITASMNSWLLPMFGEENARLDYSLDDISALIPRRKEKFEVTIQGYREGLLSLNEAREKIKLDTVEGGDAFRVLPAQEGVVLEEEGSGHEDDEEGSDHTDDEDEEDRRKPKKKI